MWGGFLEGYNMGWQVEKLLLFIFAQVCGFVFLGWGDFQNNPPDHVHKTTTTSKHPQKVKTFSFFRLKKLEFVSNFRCPVYDENVFIPRKFDSLENLTQHYTTTG